jgi:hypothetical protein
VGREAQIDALAHFVGIADGGAQEVEQVFGDVQAERFWIGGHDDAAIDQLIVIASGGFEG